MSNTTRIDRDHAISEVSTDTTPTSDVSGDWVAEKTTKIISNELKIPIDQLTPERRLQDIGAQSLDLVEIIFALEEAFDITISLNMNDRAAGTNAEGEATAAGGFDTIEDVLIAVKALVDAKTKQ